MEKDKEKITENTTTKKVLNLQIKLTDADYIHSGNFFKFCPKTRSYDKIK